MQILAELPPARLAGAMTGGRGDLQDNLLVDRLEWLRSWLAATTSNDPDSQASLSIRFKCSTRLGCDASWDSKVTFGVYDLEA